jgi:signal transduction histidine kinase
VAELTTAENYAGIVSQRVHAERFPLASRWLDRLKELLDVPAKDVFPSDGLLDHIPALIAEIAGYLRAPADEEIAANAAVIDKARELGILRHEQQASVHQLLREYEILGDILESFIVEETARLGLQPSSEECFEVCRRLTRSVRTLLRTTIDTFVREYSTAIQERNERIKSFNRMARLELVFLNLVSNAIKYSDPGKPEPFVEIAAAQDDATAGTFTVCVRDNGLGIPGTDQPAIFERFFRGHAHLDGELGVTGTGLGLAIVAECIQALGGSIRCESAVGQGTTFFVTLPPGA